MQDSLFFLATEKFGKRKQNVNEGDYRSLVTCIDKVESVHNQLKELGQLCAVHMVDIDRVTHF